MNSYDILKNKNEQNPEESALQEEEISIEKFFDILISGRNDLLSPNIVVGFFLCFAFMFILIPWQAWADDMHMAFISAIFFGTGIGMYLNPYIKITEKKQSASVLSKLKYYPADTRAIKKYLLKKTETFIRKIFIAALILQLVVTLIGYHRLTFANILYVVAVAYLWPMINAFSIIVFEK